MIKTDRQAAVSQRKYEALVEAAQDATSESDRQVYGELAEEVQAELAEYREIKAGRRGRFVVDSLDDIGEALVKARLARGWTQRELAEVVGVAEQMVQRDEAGGYERARLSRLADIAEALGYDLHGALEPSGNAPSAGAGTNLAIEVANLAATGVHGVRILRAGGSSILSQSGFVGGAVTEFLGPISPLIRFDLGYPCRWSSSAQDEVSGGAGGSTNVVEFDDEYWEAKVRAH